MLEKLKSRARSLRAETYSLYLAMLDARTPWYARGLVLLIVAYALSPIDLIPDFVPVLGYLDDVLIIPGGIALAIRLIPPVVLADARVAAQEAPPPGRLRVLGAALIVALWIVAIILVVTLARLWLASRK